MENKNQIINQSYDPRLNTISRLCFSRREELFDKLDVDLALMGDKYIGNCPIHGDSDSGAFNMYGDGYAVPGWWTCRTSKACEKKFKPTMVGFIRGRLSNLELNYHWKKNPAAIYPFPQTIKYICDFLKVRYNSIKVDPKEEERLRFIRECTTSINSAQNQQSNMPRSRVQKNLIIPSEYFLNRGFSANILTEYDVGVAKRSKPETTNRVIVPIYNADQHLIGYTCRSVFDRCKNCTFFHHPKGNCPTEDFERNLMSKWRHMDFNAQQTLYNFWEAKPEIIKTNTAILVEGPADVWKLREAGINNAVGLFGTNLHDGQERLLASAQCMTIIGLLDNDAAGSEGMRNMKEKYGRLFRMYFPTFGQGEKDIGELNTDAITNSVKPTIEKIIGLYNK